MSDATLILCHDCDQMNRIGEVPLGGSARCSRCGGLLFRRIRNSIDRTLAFTLAGMVLFLVANLLPFLAFKMQGQVTDTTLATGVRSLYEQGRPLVATLVLITTIVAPFVQLVSLILILTPMKLGFAFPGQVALFRTLHKVETWSMMEVFMLGILVSLVKLLGMAEIVPGIALWSFVLLIPVLAAANASLDHHLVWDRLGRNS